MIHRLRRLAALVATLSALLAFAPGPLTAQAAREDYPRLVVEGRLGATLPLGSFREGASLGGAIERAPSFGLHFVYRGLNGWGPQLGFSQHRFDCSADGCPGDGYVLTTWDLGLQRTLGSGGTFWLRAGSLFGRLERDFVFPFSDSDPSLAGHETSRLSLGAEAGAGVRIPIRGRLALNPGGRYGWLNTRFRGGPLVKLRWVVADLGVSLGF